MTRLYLSLLACWLFIALPSSAMSQAPETPQVATVCQLLNDPKAWDHKLVQVTGFASHGFEDSGFTDPDCTGHLLGLWMEYGGKSLTGTMSTASDLSRSRSAPVVIEGIAVPLVEDALFHRFDDFLHQNARTGTTVHATVVARFFAGQIQHFRGDVWGGYGHLGCCSLFVVQQVLSVDDYRRPDLDYSDSPDQPYCATYQFVTPLDPRTQMLEAQRRAEQGDQAYAFTSDRDVAVAAMHSYVKDLKPDALKLTIKSSSAYRRVYVAGVGDPTSSYMLVLSRPYWLSLSAADPSKVAWVVLAAFKMDCAKPK
jgi:hypothetical protein